MPNGGHPFLPRSGLLPPLNLQYQTGGRHVVATATRVEDLSAHENGGDADLKVCLLPAGDWTLAVEGDPPSALAPARRERVVHDDSRVLRVDVVRAAGVAVGGQSGLGCGGKRVLPRGVPRNQDRLP